MGSNVFCYIGEMFYENVTVTIFTERWFQGRTKAIIQSKSGEKTTLYFYDKTNRDAFIKDFEAIKSSTIPSTGRRLSPCEKILHNRKYRDSPVLVRLLREINEARAAAGEPVYV